jgi:RimJ/RimL family protein N-acetyltransferase
MKWQRPYYRHELSLPEAPILTERLCLRAIREDDFQAIWQMDSDPEVMKYIRPILVDKAAFMDEMKADFAKGQRFKFFRIIADKSTDKAMGWLILRPTEDGKWVELGYRLLKIHWGKGYAPEGSKALINLGFDKLELDEIMLVLRSENKKSSNVAERLGFIYQGIRKFYDLDLSFYLLKRPQRR